MLSSRLLFSFGGSGRLGLYSFGRQRLAKLSRLQSPQYPGAAQYVFP